MCVVLQSWSSNAFHNRRRWLWVPACAGTTPSFPIQISNSLTAVIARSDSDEAIHRSASRKLDCFASAFAKASADKSLAMTWMDMSPHSRDSFASGSCISLAPSSIRGRRESRAPTAPASPCAESRERTHTGLTGTAETSRLSPRNGLAAYFVLSPVSGLYCHRCRTRTGGADRRQGRGARTTRLRRPLQAFRPAKIRLTPQRPIATRTTLRDDRANVPHGGAGCAGYGLICLFGKAEYFHRRDLTRFRQTEAIYPSCRICNTVRSRRRRKPITNRRNPAAHNRNDLAKTQRTRSNSNESTANSTNPTVFPSLITVWSQVRILPGPPVKSMSCIPGH